MLIDLILVIIIYLKHMYSFAAISVIHNLFQCHKVDIHILFLLNQIGFNRYRIDKCRM